MSRLGKVAWFVVGMSVALAAGAAEAPKDRPEGKREAPRWAPTLKVGQAAPEFELPRLVFETDADGKTFGKVSEEKVKLRSLLGKKPICLFLSSYT